LPQVVNLSSPIAIRKSDGTLAQYFPTADTDAARGAALDAALTAHEAGDRIEVSAPCEIDAALPGLKSYTSLVGISAAAEIKLAASLDGTTISGVITNDDTTDGNTEITIEGLKLDGNNTSLTNDSFAQSGIRLTKCTNSRILNNTIEHFGRAGTPSCIGIIPVGCTDTHISGNIITDCVDGINTSSAANPCSRLTITNNTVNSTNRDYAINVFNCLDSIISHNVLRSELAAINVQQGALRNTISDNKILSSTTYGIAIGTVSGTAPADNVIRDNTVEGCDYGIVLLSSAGTGNVIRDNDVRGAGTTADLFLEATPAGTVVEHNLQTNTTAGTGLSVTGAITATGIISGVVTSYSTTSSGTFYELTASANSSIDFSVTDPVITITTAGTYLVWGSVEMNVTATAESYAALFRIRKTSGTPSNVTGAQATITHDASYDGTATGSDTNIHPVTIAPVLYTAAANDVLTITGQLTSGTPGAVYRVQRAQITAARLGT
jgi:parallel beta-helix repeat protein